MDVKEITSALSKNDNKRNRLPAKVEEILNNQIGVELNASQFYKAMGAWCSFKGLNGTANFLFKHVEEERVHMNKIYEYMLDRGALPKTPATKAQECCFVDLKTVLNKGLEHEFMVTDSWTKAMDIVCKENDQVTKEFMRFYFSEQREEENIYINLLDRMDILGTDKIATYMLDKEIGEL
jgi:ferritin